MFGVMKSLNEEWSGIDSLVKDAREEWECNYAGKWPEWPKEIREISELENLIDSLYFGVEE